MLPEVVIESEQEPQSCGLVWGRWAGVDQVHPHRFRYDTARRLVEQVDLPTAAAVLGHSRLDTIRIYSQPDQDALQRAADLIDQG